MRPTLPALLLVAGLAVPAPLLAQSAPPAKPRQPAEPAQTHEDTAAFHFLMGRRYESLGRIDDAIAAHRKALALEPESAELRAELAGLYARQDRAREALEMAESAVAKDPDNREANRILGSIYAALSGGRQPLRPGDNPAEYAARAIAALERARQPDSFDIGLELTLGRLYVQTGEHARAVPLLQRVVDEQPGYVDGAILLAAAQEGAGRADDAIATLEGALKRNPRFYRGQLRIAEIYERQRQWASAAEALARAQAINPSAPLETRRAAALINGGRPEEARELLEGTLTGGEPDARQAVHLYLLAEAQRALKDLPAAEATAKRLLEASPQDARGLHVLSLILQDKGDVQGAERVLRDLIARDPLDANALNSLGYMFAERGERLDEAVELLQRAVKIEPDNPSYLDSLGWAYFQQGRLDLADEPLTKAAAELKDSSVVQDHLGDLRFRQQRHADAAAAWERALAGDGQDIDRARLEQKIREARSRLEKR